MGERSVKNITIIAIDTFGYKVLTLTLLLDCLSVLSFPLCSRYNARRFGLNIRA